ncbi:MAG: hypothetical protein V3S89_05935 [Desulfobacterales bacterium]
MRQPTVVKQIALTHVTGITPEKTYRLRRWIRRITGVFGPQSPLKKK